MRALRMERIKFKKILEKLQLQRVILLHIPRESSADIGPGQEVPVYRENVKPFKWIGPFKI